jgi:dihydrodipicolinate synthase/N-acetylneuraminate lyase
VPVAPDVRRPLRPLTADEREALDVELERLEVAAAR